MQGRTGLVVFLVAITAITIAFAQAPGRQWLAGDSHIHSHWSPGYERTKTPPEPIIGGDGI